VLELLQPLRLIRLRPAPVVGLLDDLTFLASLRQGLAVREVHPNLPQQVQDLFRAILLPLSHAKLIFFQFVSPQLAQKDAGPCMALPGFQLS
jgi:hypothetical protein